MKKFLLLGGVLVFFVNFIWVKDTDLLDNERLPKDLPNYLASVNLFASIEGNSQIVNLESDEHFLRAFILAQRFDYPIEKTDIVEAYGNFDLWAQSGGSQSTGWYKDESGNRNASKIY